ncbi:MAG: response regulator, partial [Pyrinomonadaceae bacterium]|nr:response regulator [Pyrinomonadaceae bacterium]
MQSKLRVYLVDDEPLAVSRLTRLLTETGRVEIIGSANEPETALLEIPNHLLDAVFLDIQMPGLNGFELLAKLETYPPVIFVTAFDEFALRAFEVHSIDYLLKPVEAERLEKALTKLEKLRVNAGSHLADLQKLLATVNANLDSKPQTPRTFERLPSRIGGRVLLIETVAITHFFAQDKVVL